jgi:phosphoglycerate dehydrogenase-like enzyme
VLVTYAKLPGELLREFTRCKVIGRFGLGVDNIDIAAAAQLGNTVTYVPDCCLREVSDHAMALLLALARKIAFSKRLVQSALDVVTVEPLAKDSPVLGRDNVILTPHTAFYSVEALEELQTKCATDVARVLSGEAPVYPVKMG